MGTSTPLTMSSCLVDMGLASYYAGDEKVRQVARASALSVPYRFRAVLMHISVAQYPSRVVNEAMKDLLTQ